MNRYFATTRLLAGCLVATVSQIAAAAAPSQAPGTSPEELLRVTFEILQKTDTDRLGELWESGSEVLKNSMSKGDFIQATRKARQSMGPITAREWSSMERLKYPVGNSSGLPPGLYANVELATRLSRGKTASERISFAQENNIWRFTGYAVARSVPPPAAPETPAKPATPTSPAQAAQTSPPAAATAAMPQPAPLPATSAGAAAGTGANEVEAAVRAWAAAWSAQDVDRYLVAYAPEFTPAGSQSRKSWEEERRARITGKASISIALDNLAVSVDGQTASARFRQTYRSEKLNSVSRKTLELQRSGNQWLIRKESTTS